MFPHMAAVTTQTPAMIREDVSKGVWWFIIKTIVSYKNKLFIIVQTNSLPF